MQKQSRWGFGMMLLGGAFGALINATIGWIFIALGLVFFIPDVHRLFHRRRPKHFHLFENLLEKGEDLTADAEVNDSPLHEWTARVIIWDRDVRDLLLIAAPKELAMYKTISMQPEQGQDKLMILDTLKERREQLRMIFGRYLE